MGKLSPEKNAWVNMRYVCRQKEGVSYELYGLKGIKVCEKWDNSFKEFLSDIGYRPFKGAVLGRLDKTKYFEPGNVKWMSKREVQDNKTNILLNWDSVNNIRDLYSNTKITQRQLAEKHNVGIGTVSLVIQNKTWKDGKYIYIPRNRNKRKCAVKGCNNPYNSKGYCSLHKSRLLRYGNPLQEPKKIIYCTVEGCQNLHMSKGCCSSHYQQFKKYGKIIGQVKQIKNKKICSVIGCDEYSTVNGMCCTHNFRNKKHGDPFYERVNKRDIPGYGSWASMLSRCTNPNDSNYGNYGGRGIAVCEEWYSFDKFYEDMGPKPFLEAEIDRMRNEGNYCVKNCRWTDRKTQTRNTRRNVLNDSLVLQIRVLRKAGHGHVYISNQLGLTCTNVRNALTTGYWD